MVDKVEHCSNCNKGIDKSEQAYVYRNKVLCHKCNRFIKVCKIITGICAVIFILSIISISVTRGKKQKRIEIQRVKNERLAEEEERKKIEIEASLSDFVLETEEFHGQEFRNHDFNITITNLRSIETTVYIVAYGKNDRYSPPRRQSYPTSAMNRCSIGRGDLYHQAITRYWEKSNPIGILCELGPNETIMVDAFFVMNRYSQYRAWKGQKIDYNAHFREHSLWIFNENGKLIFEKKYNVQ